MTDRDPEHAEFVARVLLAETPRVASYAVATPVLALLVLLEPGERTVSSARAALRLPQATMSELAQRAVDEGYVEVTTSETDRRERVMRLTPRGLRVRRRRRGSNP